MMPKNITAIFLPSRAPELNPVENVRQYLQQKWLSNAVFDTYDAIIDAACEAWRETSRRTGDHHLNRNAAMGPRRSNPMTLGIKS